MDNSEKYLELYSIFRASKLLKINRDSLKSLIAQGKIGTIQIGKRKKIAYSELIRFQKEWTIRKTESLKSTAISNSEINRFFENYKGGRSSTPPDSKAILKKIMERG
jgi:hypothetical protein